MAIAEYKIQKRNEEIFAAIRHGHSLAGWKASELSTARLYTGGWSEGQRAIDAELARREGR